MVVDMGSISSFAPEKLIIGILTSRPEDLRAVKTDLTTAFGPIDFTSSLLPFEYTSYYDREMGSPIFRCFVAFQDLISPDSLSDAKQTTNSIEDRFTQEGNRKMNLDPGLLSLKRLILASTKDNGRRVPLADGIYAEITLIFIEKDFHPVDWTYPDYKSREYKDIFCEIRDLYRLQLKQLR